MPGHSLTPLLTLRARECLPVPSEAAKQYEPDLMMDAVLACSLWIFCAQLG